VHVLKFAVPALMLSAVIATACGGSDDPGASEGETPAASATARRSSPTVGAAQSEQTTTQAPASTLAPGSPAAAATQPPSGVRRR
jgi:hypothetical protein